VIVDDDRFRATQRHLLGDLRRRTAEGDDQLIEATLASHPQRLAQ
jgi:hypothetical protein